MKIYLTGQLLTIYGPQMKIGCHRSETFLYCISCVMSNVIQVVEDGRVRWLAHMFRMYGTYWAEIIRWIGMQSTLWLGSIEWELLILGTGGWKETTPNRNLWRNQGLPWAVLSKKKCCRSSCHCLWSCRFQMLCIYCKYEWDKGVSCRLILQTR